MKTITSSVGFQDEVGNPLGSIILILKPEMVYPIIAGGGQVASTDFIINLDATGKVPAAVQVWASDELGSQPWYKAILCRGANGVGLIATVKWIISGTSPIDLSLLPSQN